MFFCSFQNRQKKLEPNFLEIEKCLENLGESFADLWQFVRHFVAAKVQVGFCAFFRSFRILPEKVQPNFYFFIRRLMSLLLTMGLLKRLVPSASVAGSVGRSKRRVWWTWDDVVGLPWVIRSSTLSANVAICCRISDSFCSALVVAGILTCSKFSVSFSFIGNWVCNFLVDFTPHTPPWKFSANYAWLIEFCHLSVE